MRKGIKLFGAGVVTVGTLITGGITHLPVAQASESWTARTCAAYAAWAKHPSTARLNAMLTDSENAPYKYIGEDAIGLYKDVRSGAAASYVAKDEKYFAEDC